MEKIREIPWLRIGAESAAIIASILLAFAIDAWWTNRTGQIRTSELLQNLEVEWTDELERVDATLEQFRSFRDSAVEALNLNQNGSVEISEENALRIFSGSSFSTYKPSTASLDLVLENGLMHVTNEALATAISSWHSVLDEPAPERDALYELTFYGVREVRQRIAHSLGLPIVDTADQRSLAWYGDNAGRLAASLYADDEFLQGLRHLVDVAESYRRQLEVVRETLTENIALLREHLGSRT